LTKQSEIMQVTMHYIYVTASGDKL